MSSKNVIRPGHDGARLGSERRVWSLATRLTAWYAVSMLPVLAVSMAFLYLAAARDLTEDDDRRLLEHVKMIRGLMLHEKNRELIWEVETEWSNLPTPPIYMRILDKSQHAIAESHGMSEILPRDAFPSRAEPGEDIPAHAFQAASGRVFRLMTAAATTGSGPGEPAVIQAAVDHTNDVALLRNYRSMAAILVALVLVGTPLIAYRLTIRGMRPLFEIVEATRRIRSSRLDERVRTDGLPSELSELASNFNHMLDRLEESFSRLSRFAADIAHELRTPLNNLRGQAEVALSRERTAEEYREVLASNIEESAHVSGVIDRLLFVARVERSEVRLTRERCDLAEELGSLLDYYEPAALERNVATKLDSRAPLWASLDRILFRRAVGNLLSNALAATGAGGEIIVSAAPCDEGIAVDVRDNGAGIAAEHLPHVLDRFYSAGDAGNRSGRLGLGLSIVKAIMDLHEGSVEIASEDGRGTCVRLRFPADAAPPQEG